MTKRTPTNSPGGIVVICDPRISTFDPYTVIEKGAHVITNAGWLVKGWHNAFTVSRAGDICPHFEFSFWGLEHEKKHAIPWAKLPRTVRAAIKRDFKDEWKHTVLAHS